MFSSPKGKLGVRLISLVQTLGNNDSARCCFAGRVLSNIHRNKILKNIPWFTSISEFSKHAPTNINSYRIEHDNKLMLTLVDKLFCYALRA